MLLLFPSLEDRGFRIVDTRISFITKLRREELRVVDPECEVGLLRLATRADLDEILELTRASFVDNPTFISRVRTCSCPGFSPAGPTLCLRSSGEI